MKTMKRCVTLIMAMAMLLCVVIPCYAVNTESTPNTTVHTIRITNAEEKDKGNFQAYQIFRGDISAGKLTNLTWGSGVVTGDALTAAMVNLSPEMAAAIASAADNKRTEAEAVASVVASWDNDSVKLDAFAEVIAAHLSDTCYVNDADAGSITVSGDGYYLLKHAENPGQGDAYTKYILKVVNNVDVTAKKGAPSAEKFIVEAGAARPATTASIGDKVEFQVVSTIPVMDGYDKYYYILNDRMTSGLTFNDDIEVSVNGKKLIAYSEGLEYADCGYAVNMGQDGRSFEIVFINFLQYKGQTGQIITTYSATVNENVAIDTNGNTNTAWLQYSNNPNYTHEGAGELGEDPTDDKPKPGEPSGTTPESFVKVYSTAVQINKVKEDGSSLSGAKFKIAGASSGIYKINGTIFQKNNSGTWYRLKDGTYTETAPADATAHLYDSTTDKFVKVTINEESKELTNKVAEGWVDSNGVLTFTGLGAGTYTITELEAPAGYNMLKNPITVKITWNGTDLQPMWTVEASTVGTDGNTQQIDAELSNNIFSINVANQEGVELPSTGGIGTTIFYIVGGLLVLVAVVLLVTKKRMEGAE